MSNLENQTEELWQKRLFERILSLEEKVDHLLVLQEQRVDTMIHPPLKPEYRCI